MKKESSELLFSVDGQDYTWHEQFITGKKIKDAAALSGEAELYLSVTDPWDDQLITDDMQVDLGRGNNTFFIRQHLNFTVNDIAFDWKREYISGRAIKKIAGIDPDDQLFLHVGPPPLTDELIGDDQEVNLAIKGTEHFISKEVILDFLLIVNGREKKWEKKAISFEEIVTLAFGKYNNSPSVVYTVTYDRGPQQNPAGSMTKKDIVRVKNKMVFNATATDKS